MTRRPVRRRLRACGCGGQATVELALCIPLVVVMVLGVMQVLVLARDQLRVELAAREGARAAVVSAEPTAAARAAANRVIPGRTPAVSTTVRADTITVRVSTRAQSTLPIVGRWIRDVELSARATMAIEPPDG